MRIVVAKSGISRRILFNYERQALDKIPLYRPVTIKRKDGKGNRVIVAKNPYLTKLLKDRYEIYQSLLYKVIITDRFGNRKEVFRIDEDKYAESVRQWYRNNHFVDANNIPDVWAAVHQYERDSKNADPNNDWFNYPDIKSNKSHHSQTPLGKQREKEYRIAYRRSEHGQAVIKAYRQQAKLNKYNVK